MNKKMYVELQKSVRIGELAEHKAIRLLSNSMIACLPSIRILLFCPARQIESFTRRIVMAWQKKHKKRPFSGKRKVNNTSEAVMYRLHI